MADVGEWESIRTHSVAQAAWKPRASVVNGPFTRAAGRLYVFAAAQHWAGGGVRAMVGRFAPSQRRPLETP